MPIWSHGLPLHGEREDTRGGAQAVPVTGIRLHGGGRGLCVTVCGLCVTRHLSTGSRSRAGATCQRAGRLGCTPAHVRATVEGPPAPTTSRPAPRSRVALSPRPSVATLAPWPPYTRCFGVARPTMLCYDTGMKTTIIYACYLPGSPEPAYIGSHNSEPPARSSALAWRYANCRYVGQGAWVQPDGSLQIPRNNTKTPWGRWLLGLTAAQLAAIRVATLATVPEAERWDAEAAALREYKPPFNAMLPQTLDVKRAKHNAYHAAYRVGYYKDNPAKAQAKRDKDRIRNAAKRAAAKLCSIT